MAKVNAKKTGKQVKFPVEKPFPGSGLSPLQKDLMALGLFTVVILILWFPVVIRGYYYEGGDTLENLAQTKKITEYYQSTGEAPLWNPYPEAGTPNVFHLPPSPFSLGFYLDKIGGILGTTFLFYLLGAAGMYFLLKYLRFGRLVSFTSSLVFLLTPYFKSLIIVGQYLPAKFEAVMVIPWIVLAFLLCLDRVKLVYSLFFALTLSVQFQTQHYQVIFYTAILLFAIGITPLVKDLLQKRYALFFGRISLLGLALLFSVLSTAWPLLPAKKYNEDTIRAKWALDISKGKTTEPRKSGVDPEFIKNWSMAPREFLDFVVPRASGGTMSENYTGKEVPELTGQIVPAYWGDLMFSGSLLYLGIPVLLSLLALLRFRNRMVAGLSLTALILALWALGMNFRPFYQLCYDILPFFKNFRTPPASLTVVYFILPVLSAYGLNVLLDKENSENKAFRKKILVVLAAFIGAGLIFYLLGDLFSFTRNHENFDAQVIPQFRKIRRAFYFSDVNRYMIFASLFALTGAAFIFRWVRREVALLGVCALVTVDLAAIQMRYTDKPVSRQDLEQKYFPGAAVTGFFNAPQEPFRVYAYSPAGKNYSSTVQTIQNNFDLQTLSPVYDLFLNNLMHPARPGDNINWNVLRMLAVKYLVFDSPMEDPHLAPVFGDQGRNEYVYTYRDPLPFGHFVRNYRVIPGDYDRLTAMNDSLFNPAVTAILDKEPAVPVSSPDSVYGRLAQFTPGRLQFEVYSDKGGLFVMSVPHLRDGWKAWIDDRVSDNLMTADHAFQAVAVPAGNHVVRLEFKPAIFKSGQVITAISSLFIYLLAALLLFLPESLKKRLRVPGWMM